MTRHPDGAEREFFHGSPADAVSLLRAAAPVEPRAGWLLGAALGALGRYGVANSQLMTVIGDESAGYASLAASTLASQYRQLGRHLDGRDWDDRALALAEKSTETAAESAFDARLGLAADAVGVGDLDAARAGLAAAQSLAAGAGLAAVGPAAAGPGQADAGLADAGLAVVGGVAVGGWRQQVRLGWVETEVALLAGDPAAAVRSARTGLALAEDAAAPRHIAKCLLFLGASQHVLAADGQPDQGAVETLERASRAAEEVAALPLRWVCAALLAERADRRGESDLALIQRRISAAAITEIGAQLPLTDRNRWLSRGDIAGIVALSA